MKHLQSALLFFFLFSFTGTRAQQNHFIYIQTEDKQPFYAKLDNNLFSSTTSGYLVIPKLKTGTYILLFGFPKSEWTEQRMQIKISNNDIGYLLKKFGTKGWGLFNLQTLEVIMATDNEKVRNVEIINKTDAFSKMLSDVVNDSTIRQIEIAKDEVKEPLKPEEKTTPVVAKEKETMQEKIGTGFPKTEQRPEINNNHEANKSTEKTETVKETVVTLNDKKSIITRSLLNKSVDGIEMIFIDQQGLRKDTIRVFIPIDNTVSAAEEKPKAIEKPKAESKPETEKKEEKLKDSRFLEVELPNANKRPVEIKEANKTKTTNLPESVTETPSAKTIMVNSDCKNIASNDDFLKLRKKMVAEDNEDDMILIAKKTFKSKCFTVEQVRNLSVLFLKDSGKYAFFDMAYPFVSDSHNFEVLQNQLSETYYLDRFKVMIRH